MSTYQSYDFIKDLEFHLTNKQAIDLKEKSEIFKRYLFRLKIFQLNNKRLTMDHPLFNEKYFIFVRFTRVYLSKRLNDNLFDYVEIMNGLKIIRKIKLDKIFK
jgi:hypothetical protein